MHLFEYLNYLMPQGDSLIELTLDGLSSDLLIYDDNLIERFGRNAQTVSILTIGNMRLTRPETKQNLNLLIIYILSGESTPSKLRLFNLGFDAQ